MGIGELLTKFSRNNLNLLVEMSKKECITCREQKTYSPFSFYLNIGRLKDFGLVKENGINKKNQKLWSLTEKGIEFVKALKNIEVILSG